MTYRRELDDLRREVRKDIGALISFWPKINGANARGYASAGEAYGQYFEVYDPAGTLIQGPSALTATDVGTAPATVISRCDVVVSAIATLGEDYSIRFYWREYSDVAGIQQLDVVYFDVVRFPFGPPSVSLNDLREERPDIHEILRRMGFQLGYTAAAETDTTPEETMAGIFAVQARIELDSLVRDAVQQDAIGASTSSTADLDSVRRRYTRPNLILNRERLNRVERKLAMKLVFAADCKNPDGDDEAAGLLRFYAAEAERAWRGVGPLKYDAIEDLVVDTTITDIGRSWTLRRTQG